MKNFIKIGEGVDVAPLLLGLHRQPHLWNRNPIRLTPNGPHHETKDIWLRYKDETENVQKKNYGNFGDPHEGVWYPSFYALPAARKIIFALMARVEGERLGGVLIYKVPPGKKIHPHTDVGWHVDFYEKFNVCLQSNPDAYFYYKDGERMYARSGDVHRFVNNVDHGVVNDGADDHIILTICVRTHDYSARVKGGE